VKVAGVDRKQIREFYEIQVDDDAWEEFMSRRNGALLGIDLLDDEKLRRQYSWEPGREFGLAFLGDQPLHMAGTFVPRDPTLRRVILADYEYVQDAVGIRGEASQLLVKVAHRDELAGVAKSIMALPHATDLHAASQREALDEALADLDSMLRYASHVMLAVAIVILIGLANATSMSVRERVREVGMLRSLGFSRRKVISLIAAESLLLALTGGLLGCAAAWATVKLTGGTIYVSAFAFPIEMSYLLPIAAGVGAVAVGILGALPAGIRVSRRPIVEAIRSVD
jgi:putative ABC transport system permease protein